MRPHRLPPLLISVLLLAPLVLTAAPASASLAWDDDPCEENGGQVAVAPDVSVKPADDHPLAYVACADGALLYHGAGGKGSYVRIGGVETDEFVDVASTADDNLYAVTSSGRIRTVGQYPMFYGDLYPTTGVVALEMTPSGRGYWIVTRNGKVAGFGDADSLGPRETTTVHSAIVAFASYGTAGGWVATAGGEIVAVGNAPDHGSVTSRIAADDSVVGIVADKRTGGFWVVTRAGSIIEAGGAPAEHDSPKCLTKPGARVPFSGAVGEPDPDAPAPLWIYSVHGGICGFAPGR